MILYNMEDSYKYIELIQIQSCQCYIEWKRHNRSQSFTHSRLFDLNSDCSLLQADVEMPLLLQQSSWETGLTKLIAGSYFNDLLPKLQEWLILAQSPAEAILDVLPLLDMQDDSLDSEILEKIFMYTFRRLLAQFTNLIMSSVIFVFCRITNC